jgi:hypothetical protein
MANRLPAYRVALALVRPRKSDAQTATSAIGASSISCGVMRRLYELGSNSNLS